MPTFTYCTPSGLACAAKVAKDAFDCMTPCTGVYADVFRADDTKLANLMHGLAKEGSPQKYNDITFKGSSGKTGPGGKR